MMMSMVVSLEPIPNYINFKISKEFDKAARFSRIYNTKCKHNDTDQVPTQKKT